MSSRLPFVVIMVFVAIGCRPADHSTTTTVDLDRHRATFVVPSGWLHIDHGREQIFEKETARISIADLGPATPGGFRETLEEARDLFRDNQWEDARSLLIASNPRSFFPKTEQWNAMKDPWRIVTNIRRRKGENVLGDVSMEVSWEVENGFHDLLVAVGTMESPSLETLSLHALEELGYDSLRGIASQEATAISGRSARLIDTWDRLSHTGRRRFLFISSDGRLLCMHTKAGFFEVTEPAFESLRESLSLAATQGSGGA